MEDRRITIILADDHKMVRQGFRAILELEPDFEVVGEAGEGSEAVKLVEKLKPDILVTDLKLHGLNGIDVIRLTRQRSPGTHCIALSMYSDKGYVRGALEVGARGYVIKGSGIEELVKAIREVAAGSRYLSPPLSLREFVA